MKQSRSPSQTASTRKLTKRNSTAVNLLLQTNTHQGSQIQLRKSSLMEDGDYEMQ